MDKSTNQSLLEENITLVLLAEFDNENGIVVRHKYPVDKYESILESSKSISDLMIPDGSHRFDFDWTIFFLHRDIKRIQFNETKMKQLETKRASLRGWTSNHDKPFLYCLNLICNQRDQKAVRGARIFSIAILSGHRFFNLFKPLLYCAVQKYLESPSETILHQLYESINSIDLKSGKKRKSIVQLKVKSMRKNIGVLTPYLNMEKKLYADVMWNGENISLCNSMHEVEFCEISLVMLVEKFEYNLIGILNAIFCGDNVLFFGEKMRAGTICQYILAASAVIFPLQIVDSRVFPFVNIHDLSCFTVKGFLIGTSNSWIEQQSTKFQLHDVLVNLETGKVMARKQTATSYNKRKTSADLDKQLIKSLLEGISKGYGEIWVRKQFQDYFQHIIDTAFGVEYYENMEQAKAEELLNYDRVQKWKQTESFKVYVEEWVSIKQTTKLDLSLLVKKLKQPCKDKTEIGRAFQALMSGVTEQDQIKELLFYLTKYNVKLADYLPFITEDFLLASSFVAKVERLKKTMISDLATLIM